jgi:hypothetical protein
MKRQVLKDGLDTGLVVLRVTGLVLFVLAVFVFRITADGTVLFSGRQTFSLPNVAFLFGSGSDPSLDCHQFLCKTRQGIRYPVQHSRVRDRGPRRLEPWYSSIRDSFLLACGFAASARFLSFRQRRKRNIG